MNLLYCYIRFLDTKGMPRKYHGQTSVELNLSTTHRYNYDFENNTLNRESRKVRIPVGFWTEDKTDEEYSNIYNINIIAGENGAGKSTAIRCLMNLMNYFHNVICKTNNPFYDTGSFDIENSRALLLVEEEGYKHLLTNIPICNNEKKDSIILEGMIKDQLIVHSCRGREVMAHSTDNRLSTIKNLLSSTKVIYMTNTLNQYDYERHYIENYEHRRNFFIYDVSIGSTIGSDMGQFFVKEVYKQVKYVFDKEQADRRKYIAERRVNKERKNGGHRVIDDRIEKNITGFRIPNSLCLRLRLDHYRINFPNSKQLSNDNSIVLTSGETLQLLLGKLCVCAFADNLQVCLKNNRLPAWLDGNELDKLSSFDKNALCTLRLMISKCESQFKKTYDHSNFSGHTGAITSMIRLPETRGSFVSGSTDHTLRVWDATTGRCLQVLEGHNLGITCMLLLPYGHIASGSNDSTVRIWDVSKGICLRSMWNDGDGVTCMALLPKERIVCGYRAGVLRIWDYQTDQIMILEGHTRPITCVTILPDGRIVSGSEDKTLRIWNPKTGKCLDILKKHSEGITCVASLSGGKAIVSGSSDGCLRIWDSNTGKCLKTLTKHRSKINCIAVFKDERRFVCGSDDGKLIVWDSDWSDDLNPMRHLGDRRKRKDGHTAGINCIEILTDERIVSGSKDNTIRIWSKESGNCMHTMKCNDEINSLAILFDGQIICSGSANCSVRVWDIKEDQFIFDSSDLEHGLGPGRNFEKQVKAWKQETPNQKDVGLLKEACEKYLCFLSEQDILFSKFIRKDINTFEISLDAVRKERTEGKTNSIYNDLMDFVSKYQSTCDVAYTIDFDWGLSSGEENMLRIFSNLYHIFDRNDINIGNYTIYNNEKRNNDDEIKRIACNTVLLLMDEADLTFHPEWQRCMISTLSSFVPQIFQPSWVKDIQMVISTHSPLLLGDIPRENITYLYYNEGADEIPRNDKAKGEESSHYVPEETFGQNIHTILKDSFFLKEGTVGAFAANKINTAAKRLNEIIIWADETRNNRVENLQAGEMENIRQIIDMVAPGVLRNQLEELFRKANDTLIKIEDERNTKRGRKARTISQAQQVVKSYFNLPQEEQEYVMRKIRQEKLSK